MIVKFTYSAPAGSLNSPFSGSTLNVTFTSLASFSSASFLTFTLISASDPYATSTDKSFSTSVYPSGASKSVPLNVAFSPTLPDFVFVTIYCSPSSGTLFSSTKWTRKVASATSGLASSSFLTVTLISASDPYATSTDRSFLTSVYPSGATKSVPLNVAVSPTLPFFVNVTMLPFPASGTLFSST